MNSAGAIKIAVVDLTAITVLIEALIWSGLGHARVATALLIVLLAALSVFVHRVRRESFRDVVAASGAAKAALCWVLAFGVPTLCVIGVTAVIQGSAAPSASKIALRWIDFVVIGTVQQYVLLAHLYRSNLDLIGWRPAAKVATALLFGAFHLPNGFLVAVTAVAGVAACFIYDRARNILILGIAHGSLSCALYYGLPRVLTEGLRIGPQLAG